MSVGSTENFRLKHLVDERLEDRQDEWWDIEDLISRHQIYKKSLPDYLLTGC